MSTLLGNLSSDRSFYSVWSQLCAMVGDACLGWRAYSDKSLKVDDGVYWHVPTSETAPLKVDEIPWGALLDGSQDNQWQVMEAADSPLACWTAVYRSSVSNDAQCSCAFMLVLVSRQAQPLDNSVMNLLPWLAGWMALQWYNDDKTRQLKNLQHLMLSQSVWMECVEWLKVVDKESDKFYKGFLPRAMLLMKADFALLVWDAEDGRQFRWNGGKLSEAMQANLLEKMTALEIPLNTAFNPDDCEDHPLWIVPLNNPHFRHKGAILFGKKPGKDAFGVMEEMYFNQLVSQCASVLEKNSLVEELHNWHEQLLFERVKEKELLEKLKSAQDQLIQSEKLASIGQLAAGVAHEINNPVGYVSCNLSSLERYFQTLWAALDKSGQLVLQMNAEEGASLLEQLVIDEDLEFVREDLGQLIKETREGLDRVKRIVDDLKDFSRSDSGEFLPVSLSDCVEKTLNIVHNELKYKAEVIRDFDDIPKVELAESQFGQVIMNLLVNAAQAMETQGTIHISIKRHGENEVCVAVRDTAKGMPPEVQKKIFDPFFTTKPVGKGTGLGLSISYGIVQRHHGSIDVESEEGKGTTFHIYLPIKQPEQG